MDTQRLARGADGPVGELDGLPQPAPAPWWLRPLLWAEDQVARPAPRWVRGLDRLADRPVLAIAAVGAGLLALSLLAAVSR